MPVQMTREEYEKKYGVSPGVLTPEARIRSQIEQPDTRGVFSKVADNVTDFIGARGIAEQMGANIARTGALLKGDKQTARMVEDPKGTTVIGSALQSGANLIPGAGLGASLARKVAIGGVTGYTADVGSDVQSGKSYAQAVTPDIGTAIGVSLPVLGKIIGSTPKALEKANLRLTPTEQQNLAKNGKDIADWMAKQKIIGTPEQRLAKVKSFYDQLETELQSTIDKDGSAFSKDIIIDKIRQVVDDYSDDPLALPQIDRAISDFETFIARKKDYLIKASDLNKWKRAYWERAFTKNKADVKNEADYAIGSAIKNILDDEVPRLQDINKRYSNVIPALRVLRRAASRNQLGLLNRALVTGVGAAAGGSLGGFFGATVGGVASERLASVLATPIRSTTGAGVQTLKEALEKIPVDDAGNIPAKLLIQALTGEQEDKNP